MEDDLIFFENGSSPDYFLMEDELNFLKMEDILNFIENSR